MIKSIYNSEFDNSIIELININKFAEKILITCHIIVSENPLEYELIIVKSSIMNKIIILSKLK